VDGVKEFSGDPKGSVVVSGGQEFMSEIADAGLSVSGRLLVQVAVIVAVRFPLEFI